MKKNKTIMGISIGIILIAAATWGLNIANKPHENNIESMETMAKEKNVGPSFDADTAYHFVTQQCDFGYRIPNTAAHKQCSEWIVGKFQQYGCNVTSQKTDLMAYDGTILKAHNIIAKYKPEATARILLCAHWDCRPWADNDPDSANWKKSVMGANDGASGIAVMLEMARLLNIDTTANIGIDFVCFDAEDWGTPQWETTPDNANSWALGAQYWAKNYNETNRPMYGILLDMVGGQGAKFYQESASKHYAPDVVKRVWKAARAVGYGSFFPNQEGGYITDDHIPVNQYANIPTIDIVPYYPDCTQSSFGPTWHTINDTPEYIDRTTLKAVGQTIVQVIYTENQ